MRAICDLQRATGVSYVKAPYHVGPVFAEFRRAQRYPRNRRIPARLGPEALPDVRLASAGFPDDHTRPTADPAGRMSPNPAPRRIRFRRKQEVPEESD